MNVIDYDRKLRVNVYDSRGPQREILASEFKTDGTLLTMSCGHVASHNPIYQYEIGSKTSCFSCRFADDNVISQESI